MTDDIKLVKTCGSYPEQYDAFLDGVQVGYLRLRHGAFTVSCPDAGDKIIFSAEPEGDGEFQEFERDFYLGVAKQAIEEFYLKKFTPDHLLFPL